jgi:uncharacterized protein YlxW (UPF0749 family)
MRKFAHPHFTTDLTWRNTETIVVAMILALLAGVFLAIPFKILNSMQQNAEDKANPANQAGRMSFIYAPRQELISTIITLTDEKDNLKDSLMKERDQLGKLEKSMGQMEVESETLLESYRDASILAGLRGVKGQGIILRLEEAKEPIPAGEEVNPYLIHQEDLLNITNELWAAGAEAMAIRSSDKIERIVTTTAIRCVGPVVLVNNQPMAPPFEILTIGDPLILRQSLEGPGRVLQPLSYFNITYTIEDSQEITIPPFSGAIRTDFIELTEENKSEEQQQ